MRYNLLSEDDFEEMYHEYFPKIYNYVFYRVLSREDTEDIVSEVFFKAARNAHTFDEKKAGISTWLYSITKNTIIDYFRKKQPELLSVDKDISSAVNISAQEALISSEKRRAVFRVLLQLSERERLIIYYRFFEGFTNRKIACVLDMNESTVSTVLSRTLKKMSADAMLELSWE